MGDAPARTKVGGASDGAAGALAFHASLNVALSFVHSHTGSLGLAAVTRLPEAGEGATSKAGDATSEPYTTATHEVYAEQPGRATVSAASGLC